MAQVSQLFTNHTYQYGRWPVYSCSRGYRPHRIGKDIVRRAAIADLPQDTFRDKTLNLPESGVLRRLADLRPLGRREIPLKTVEQHVDHPSLVRGKVVRSMQPPELRL